MPDRVRVIRHTPEGIPDSGSFEVRVDDKPLKYFYWDDDKTRRSIRNVPDQEKAREAAKELARAVRERLKEG